LTQVCNPVSRLINLSGRKNWNGRYASKARPAPRAWTASGGRLDSPGHKDHNKYYVQSYIAQYGVRKVEANALVTRPEAGRQLMRDTLAEYIDADKKYEFESRMEELREELEENVMGMMKDKFEEERD
jgi:hypothetical protein